MEITIDYTTTLSATFSERQLRKLLARAFEGISKEWIEHIVFNPGDPAKMESPINLYDIPFQKGGWIKVFLKEAKGSNFSAFLDITALEQGMQLFAKTAPVYFSQVASGDYSDDACDVFLQICLFKEIVFGLAG